VPPPPPCCLQLSNETRQLWKYEQSLLHAYSRLVQLVTACCSQLLRVDPRSHHVVAVEPQSLTAVRCLSRLLTAGHHFNCRKELIACAVPLLNHPHRSVRQTVHAAVCAVFRQDSSREATADIAQRIAAVVKRKSSEAAQLSSPQPRSKRRTG
jgi:hypothetical protein